MATARLLLFSRVAGTGRDRLPTAMSSIALASLHCLKPKSLEQVKQLHAFIITADLKSPPLLGKLVEHYCSKSLQCAAAADYAHRIVNHQDDQKQFLLNTLIKASHPRDSVLIFSHWLSRSCLSFDDHTYIFAFGACARSTSRSALIEGQEIHARVIKEGLMLDLKVATACVYFYGSNGEIVCARKMFDEMPVRNSITWSALLAGYCSRRGQASAENASEALLFFKAMLADGEDGVRPKETAIASVLSASSRLGVLETGICIHGLVEKTICDPENDVFIGTCFVDMYAKSGNLNTAMKVFNRMKEKNVMTWTAMATGLAFHGNGKQALELLEEMKRNNVVPNAVTFTSLLSACCHAGLVDEGLELYNAMESGFGITPNVLHYGCVVDLLGRAGHLEEAYEFVVGLDIEPDPVLWRSLLSSCRMHGDVEMGEKVGKVLVQIEPSSKFGDFEGCSQDYVGLSNVYALAGRWEDLNKVRERMKMKKVELKAGRSLVKSCFI